MPKLRIRKKRPAKLDDPLKTFSAIASEEEKAHDNIVPFAVKQGWCAAEPTGRKQKENVAPENTSSTRNPATSLQRKRSILRKIITNPAAGALRKGKLRFHPKLPDDSNYDKIVSFIQGIKTSMTGATCRFGKPPGGDSLLKMTQPVTSRQCGVRLVNCWTQESNDLGSPSVRNPVPAPAKDCYPSLDTTETRDKTRRRLHVGTNEKPALGFRLAGCGPRLQMAVHDVLGPGEGRC